MPCAARCCPSVLKFAPVQSIFRTKFCPGLGLFPISLREKNALCSPGDAPILGYCVLKFALVQSISEQNFAPVLGYLYVFER